MVKLHIFVSITINPDLKAPTSILYRRSVKIYRTYAYNINVYTSVKIQST